MTSSTLFIGSSLKTMIYFLLPGSTDKRISTPKIATFSPHSLLDHHIHIY